MSIKQNRHHYTSEYRLKEINEYFNEHGTSETLQRYGIKEVTLNRYQKDLGLSKKPRHAKILLLDIETLPIKCYAWDVWKQNIAPVQIIAERSMICWSAKWLFSTEIMSDCVTPEEILKRDDKRICKSIWQLMEQADVIIGHNGKDFDVKILNTRFLINGFMPPSPYQIIDTLLQARSQFAFISNKLDFIGRLLVNKNKLATDFRLWKRCDNGDQKALDYMVKYNKFDIVLLENAYLYLRPWMKSHPNMAILLDATDTVCTVCGSSDIVEIDDHPYNTMVSSFIAMRCNNCGATPHKRVNTLTKDQRKLLLANSAR
jgi:hypothetical protein